MRPLAGDARKQPGTAAGRKALLLFGSHRLDSMLAKGNVWYVRHYEAWFDEVHVAYLLGSPSAPVSRGRTSLYSLARGSGPADLILAPWRLWRLARRVRPTAYLTGDLAFSWWTACLVRLLAGARVRLMPVCMPEEIYRRGGRSLSGVPVGLERLFIKLSFLAAGMVITGKNIGVYREWLSSLPQAAKKLRLVDVLVDELPPPEFYEALGRAPAAGARSGEPRLLYVGRLNREKRVADLIGVLASLSSRGIPARLSLAGDGPEKGALEELCRQQGLEARVEFLGFVPSGELPSLYRSAAVFISPLTGTALREAALCGTPVAAYRVDWVRGFLVHGENALLAEDGDVEGLAAQVKLLLEDRELAVRLAGALHRLALDWWGPERVAAAMEQAFGQES